MVSNLSILATTVCISAAVLLFTIASVDTSRFAIYPALAQINGSNVTNSSNNGNRSTMNLVMSELAKIHLMAANEALMKGNTTAAFGQMNLAYLQLSMLGMKDMGTLNYTEAMKFMQSGPKEGSSLSNTKVMVPDNCIIIHGGILECRDILTGSYSLAK
jgi:hypothetical protein